MERPIHALTVASPPKTGDAGHAALLNRAARAFGGPSSLEQPEALIEDLRQALGADGWSLWLLDTASGELVCAQAEGLGVPPIERDQRVDLSAWPIGWVARSDTTIHVADARTDAQGGSGPFKGVSGIPVGAILCAPLAGRADTLWDVLAAGALLIVAEEAYAFTDHQRALLEALATIVGRGIEVRQLRQATDLELAERKRAELALRQSETRYRTLFETSPDAIAVISTEGTIAMCNRRAMEMYGCHHSSEMLGKHFLALFAPRSRRQALTLHRQALEGQPAPTAELVMLRQDGSTFEAEYVATLVAGSDGSADNVVSFIHDITDRREAENIIRRHNQELKTLNAIATLITQAHDLEQMLHAILVQTLEALDVDTGWILLFENIDQRRRPSSPSVLVSGSTPIGTDPSLSEAPLLSWLRRRITRSAQPVLISTDELPQSWVGRELLCQVAAAPLLSRGQACGMLVVVGLRDQRPRAIRIQQMQLLSAIAHQVSIAIENTRLSAEVAEIELLRELDRMQSELIASFSHELRTPLGLIKMAATTLQRDDVALAPPVVRELLTDIEVQTDRLARMVDSALELGQMASGTLSLHRVAFSLEELLQRVASQTERVNTSHHIDLDLAPSAPAAWGDPERVEQVVHNLLDNAIKYAPDRKRIVARLRHRGHFLSVSIRDHGIGIAAEHRDLVFERFYRVNPPELAPVTGAGLGLATCKGIVEAHGGRIWVEDGSTEDDGYPEGTTITFTLPVYQQPA